MRNKITLAGLVALASCAGAPPHHRGGFGAGMGEGMPNFQSAPHVVRTAGTADADAILFASFDRDGDLLVSPAELNAGIVREFARADANHDGAIDAAEYRAWSQLALGGIYAPFRQDVDRDGDGKICTDEFAAEFRARAHRYDSNGDGVLEHAELVRSASGADDDLQLLTPQSGGGQGADDGGGPPRRRR
ncbi:MAG: hypothetical protein QM759_11310 [Terricaulis sp.]